MKFNKTGQFLATGGQDGYVIIWKVNIKKNKRHFPCINDYGIYKRILFSFTSNNHKHSI